MRASTCLFGLLLLLTACSNPAGTPPVDLATAASSTAERRVSSTSDDVEETSSGSMVRGSSAQVLNFSTDSLEIGLRFSNLNVPQGAKITKAQLEFRAAASDAGSTTLSVRAHDTDSAPGFKNETNNVSSRRATSASVRWSLSSWRWNNTYRSDDLSSVVQGVVDRKGWRDGNALAFMISGDDQHDRQAVASNRSRGDAPKLYVWYESDDDSGGDTPTVPSGGSAEQREWLGRLLATVENPRYDQYNGWMDPKKQAASGDLYVYGRNFNNYATSLILAYRETGERDLIRQLDRLMNIAKGKLKDTNGDGYKNWGFDRGGAPFYGKDIHEMDEILTHSMVAATAYAFKQAGFDSSARFWTDYLQNDFEAKWRERNDKPSGFPFLRKTLMHPYSNFIRYHLYMYKLTGKSEYYSEAKRMVGVVKDHMKTTSTPNGTGYTWDHRINDGTNQSYIGCQPTVYIRYTLQAFADLATLDSSLFDSTFMKRVANTVAHKVLKDTDGSYLTNNVCGGGGKYGNLYYFVSYPYSVLARWDASGRLELATRRAYDETERSNKSSPRIYNLPAIMVFTLGK